MAIGTHDDEEKVLAQLDAQFRSRYAGPAPAEDPGSTPEAIDAAVDKLVQAIRRPGFPILSAADVATLGGQLTPQHRELLLALVELLRNPEIARRLGFGPRVFQELFELDVAVENFGAAADRLGQSFSQAEDLQNRGLDVLCARVLVEIERDIAQGQIDVEDSFQAARNEQARLAAERTPGAPAGAPARPTLKELQDKIAAEEKDGTLMQNVDTVLRTAQALEAQGRLFLPASPVASPGKAPGKGQPGGGK